MADTIFALASGSGRAGVAVIRISGPDALAALAHLGVRAPEPRRAALRRLTDPATGAPLDDALVLVFLEPASFTGETVVEIQCHGSRAVIERTTRVLCELPSFRPAQPGEFTRRAFENGKLDLAQVEGLADLLAAETEAQRRQAQFVASGHLSRLAGEWRDRLVAARAYAVAAIDFADELGDLDFDPMTGDVNELAQEMKMVLGDGRSAERIRDGFTVALCGAPNAGKSTLMNTIARRDVSITSEIAGTTRDVIEIHMDLGGIAVTMLDTAGLRESWDAIERVGIERTRRRIEAADLRVFLLDPEGEGDPGERHRQVGDVVVGSKADRRRLPGLLLVSGRTGEGVSELLALICGALRERTSGELTVANARQRQAVGGARAASLRASELMQAGGPVEMVAHELEEACRALDFLAGRVDVELVLDVVFRQFCLGK